MGFLGNSIQGHFGNKNNGQNPSMGRAAPNGWNQRGMFGAANPFKAFSMFGPQRPQMQQPQMPQQNGMGRQWMGSPYSMLNGMNGMWRR